MKVDFQPRHRCVLGSGLLAILLLGGAAQAELSTGYYVGDGQDNRAITGVGFPPDVVIIKADWQEGGQSPAHGAVCRTSTMTGDVTKRLGDVTEFLPDLIQTLDADGFTIGGDDDVNKNHESYYWIAFRAEPGLLHLGSYLGDGQDNRSITGAGFQPNYVIVMSEGNENPYQRSSAMVGDFSLPFDDAGFASDRIQALELDGFQVGKNASVNKNGILYHYVAWKTSPAQMTLGAYTGNGIDDRAITSAGFRPEYAIIKAASNQPGAHRPESLVIGDATANFHNAANFPGGIKGFLSNGFRLGTSAQVNASGTVYYWMAFNGHPLNTNLSVTKTVDMPTANEGNTLTYEITVRNTGPNNATGVQITDTLPPEVAFLSGTANQGSYDSGTGLWTVGSVLNGATAVLVLRASILPGTAGMAITNGARLTALDQVDTHPEDDSDADETSVNPNASELIVVTGSYVGDDVSGREITGLGFQPDVVIIKGENGEHAQIRTATLGAGLTKSLDEDRLPQQGMILDFQADGFSVGSDNAVNDLGKTYFYTALRAAPGELACGAYRGDGADNHDVSGLGFAPDYVIVMSEGAAYPYQRSSAMLGDASTSFKAEVLLPDRIQALQGDGFQVGTDWRANQAGILHHYVAVEAFPGRMAVGTYTGNGLDDRNLTGLGIQPLYLIVKADAGRNAVHRPAAVGAGDMTLRFDGNPSFNDAIQMFYGDGFQVGTKAEVNSAGTPYYWMAFGGSGPMTDLGLEKSVDLPTPNEGNAVTYTLTLRNLGPNAANAIEVTDPLPAGLTHVAHVCSQGSYETTSGLWRAGDLTIGAMATLTIRALVAYGTAGTVITNTAEITAALGPDPNGGNDSDSVDITVNAAPPQASIATGSYVGNVLDNRAITGIGFRPDVIIVKGDLNQHAHIRTASMAQDVCKSMDQDAAPVQGIIKEFLADGFLIGSGDAVNRSGISYYWIAFRSAPGELELGTYSGNGNDNRNITGLGFAPDYVMVLSEGAYGPLQRSSAMSGDNSTSFQNEGLLPDLVQALQPDGFQVGTSARVNQAGTVHHYLAWKSIPERMAVGSYNGNGADNRDITGLGLQPSYLIIKAGTARGPAQRPGSLGGGDVTLKFDGSAAISNAIQMLYSDGFQVGTASEVNLPSTTFYWMGFAGEGAEADLALSQVVDVPAPNEGNAVTYTLTVQNLGPAHTNGIEVTDLLPAGMTYLAHQASQGSFESAAGLWRVGGLPYLGSATLTIRALVDYGIGGSVLTNTAVITSSLGPDPNGANDSASVDIAVNPSAAQASMATGSYTGDGLVGRAISGLGFQPDVVIVKGDVGQRAYIRTATMVSGSCKDMEQDVAPVSGLIPGFLSDGFTLGGSAEVNAGGVLYTWIAFRTAAGEMVTGAFTGDGSDNREIAGVGFRPDYVVLASEGAFSPLQRSSAMPADASTSFQGEALLPDLIQALEPDGFQVGTSARANQTGTVHHYVAWKAIPGRMSVGTYTGNGSDNRNLTGLDLQPAWVVIKAGTNQEPAHRPAGLGAGDLSLKFDNSAIISDAIQALYADGFQLGTKAEVNAAGTPYYWMGFAGLGASTDLGLDNSVDMPTANEGNVVNYTLTLKNPGPNHANGIEVTDHLPVGTSYITHVASQGSYDSGTGLWRVGDVLAGASATLSIRVAVDYGTAGLLITNTAAITAALQPDPDGGNNSDAADIAVNLALTSARVASGTYTGDGQDDRSVGGVGFQPDVVIVKGNSAASATIRTGTMSGDMAKSLADGLLPEPNLIQGSQSDGFTIGSDLRVNQSGVAYTWIAFRAAVGALSLGSYLGNGADNRDITGVGFQPDYAIVLAENADFPWQRFASMAGDNSVPFRATGQAADHIQSFLSDGFQVGTDDAVNGAGFRIHYIAWKRIPGQMAVGWYTGNGQDNTNITGLSFSPEYLAIKAVDNIRGSHRATALGATDATLNFVNVANFADGIQQFLPDGFQIGSQAQVNSSLRVYHYAGFANTAGADVEVGKSVDNATPNEGDVVTFTVIALNHGPGSATTLQVSDHLPAGLSYFSSSATQGSYNSSSGIWNIGTLLNGAGATLLLRATVDVGTGGSAITNSAAVAGVDQFDPVPGNNSAAAVIAVQAADLEVSKDVDNETPNEGATIHYEIRLANLGPDEATAIQVTDQLPVGLTFVAATASQGSYIGSSGLWNVGGVTAGATATLILTATVNAGTAGLTIINTAAVSGADQFDPVPANNSDAASLRVGSSDLRVTKIVDNPNPNEAAPIVYTVSVINNGPNDGTGIVVTDQLPAGVALVSASPGQGGYDSGSGEWLVGNVASGASATVVLRAIVDTGTAGATIINTARVTAADQADPIPGNNSAASTIIVQSVDLALTKTVDNPTPSEGDIVQYAVVLLNNGPDHATGISVSDLLPAGLTFVSSTPSQGLYAAGTGLWSVGNVATGGTATLLLSAQISAGTAGTTIPNTASVTASDQADLVPGNDSATVEIRVTSADLALGKMVDNPAPHEGDQINYVISVANEGPDRCTGIQITDQLPAGVGFVTAVPTTGSYDPASGIWTVGSLDSGDNAGLQVTVTVDAGTAGSTIINSADITAADQVDPVLENNSAAVSIGVGGADLAVAKTVDNPEPGEGATVHYTVLLENLGPDDGTGIAVTDALPAGVTFVSAAAAQGSYDSGSGLWIVGAVPAEDAVSLAITATVDPGTAGTIITNGAAVTARDQADAVSANDSDSVDIHVVSVDLAVDKSVDMPVANEGDAVHYTVTLSNHGPDAGTGISVSDLLPTGVTFISAMAGQGSYDGGTGVWQIGDVPSGSSAVLTITARVDEGTAGSTITNSAAVASLDQADPVPDNDGDTASVTVASADLEVHKSVDVANPVEGQTINYAISLGNHGPDQATGVAVTDVLPAGITYLAATPGQGSYDSGTGTWTVGPLSSGTSVSLTLTVQVDAGTAGSTITNAASVLAVDQADPQPGNDADAVEITVQSADLELQKAVDNPRPNEGQSVVFTLTLQNHGPHEGTGIEVTDILPVGLTLVAATPSQGSYADGTGIWSIGALPTGGTVTLDIVAAVAAGTAGSTLTNTASITAVAQTDPVPGNNSDSADITVPSADLRVRKTVDDEEPQEGALVTYTITLTNGGPDAGTGIAVRDTLPEGMLLQSATPNQGTYDGVTGIWTIGDVAAGALVAMIITAQVGPGTAGATIVNIAEVLAADQGDPNPGNNSDDAVLAVQVADLALAKSVDPPQANEGDTVLYTIAVTNNGPNGATGILIADNLPAGLSFDGAQTSQGVYDSASGIWNVGSLARNGSATLDLTASVDRGTAGSTIINTATVSAADQTDLQPENNSASAAVTIQVADLALLMGVDTPRPNVGDAVRFTITLSNLGPHTGRGIAVQDTLPAGLTFVSATCSQGSFAQAGGLWTVGDLDSSSSASMQLVGTVDAGTAGEHIINQAAIAAASQPDPDAQNNVATSELVIQSSDLTLAKVVDQPAPDEGDLITYTITLTNGGPDFGTGIAVSDPLPAGLTLFSANPSQGSYNGSTGLWNVGSLAVSGSAVLTLIARVEAGAGGSGITNTATVTAHDQEDPQPADNQASVQILAQSVDLALAKVVDEAAPNEGDTVTFTITLDNLGPDAGSGITVTDVLPDHLMFVSAMASQGTYDHVSGLWQVGALSPGSQASLAVQATVASNTAGRVLANTATITEAAEGDPDPQNNSATATVHVTSVHLRAIPAASQAILPGADLAEAMRLEIINAGVRADTLRFLTLTNATSGPGTPDQLDGDWAALQLYRDEEGSLVPLDFGGGSPSQSFVGGRITWGNLGLAMAAGDTLQLIVKGSASLQARDADILQVAIAQPADLGLRNPLAPSMRWPFSAERTLVVDGFVAAQMVLQAIPPTHYAVGSTRNLALDVTLPPNGYQSDQLNSLNVINGGTALAGSDINRMEAWADDGDGTFSTIMDTRLGELLYTGDRWELTGLTCPVSTAGLHVYITVDITPDAEGGRTIRLGLSSWPYLGVGMNSANDGPIDHDLSNPYVQNVSVSDRVILQTAWINGGMVLPGQARVPLLHLVAQNYYARPETLTSLSVTNGTRSSGAATQLQLDGQIAQIKLWQDVNGNEMFDEGDGPPIGQTAFQDGGARFEGLRWSLPAAATGHLFLTATISLMKAADGDVIGAVVAEPTDLDFSEPVAVAGDWPLTSGSGWTVNGMVAAQVANQDVPAASLAAGDGPALALDLTVPANGYRQDTFKGLDLINLGSATSNDIARIELWRDDGDGTFEPEAGEDHNLGELIWNNGIWRSGILAEAVPAEQPGIPAGLHVFVSLNVSDTPVDSATVRLAIPVGGLTMDSSNDGPVDVRMESRNEQLLSTAPLLSSLEFLSPVSTVGQPVSVRMRVRNVGLETVVNLVPTSLTLHGDPILSPVDGPVPSSLDLAPQEVGEFLWTWHAETSGQARLSGGAGGLGQSSGLPRSSYPTTSGSHQVFEPVNQIALYYVANMPFYISRGQSDVVPLTLTLVNPGGDQVADAQLNHLRFRLEDEHGAGIVPAQLLSRVVVSEGANVYARKDTLESAGDEVDLPLTPVRITGQEPVTIGLRINISATTTKPSFRVVIPEAGWIEATDGINGLPVPVVLQEGQYPIVSGLGRIVDEAVGLQLELAASPGRHVGRGQSDVAMLQVKLDNSLEGELASAVEIGSFTVSLTDSQGHALAEPGQLLQRIGVRGPFQEHTFRAVTAADDTVLALFLTPPLTVPVNTPLEMSVFGTIADQAPAADFRVRLGEAGDFDIRDSNTGARVPALYKEPVIAGGNISVEMTASELLVAGHGQLPTSLIVGARQVTALTAALRHPGPPGVAAIRVDTLAVLCRDAHGYALQSAAFIDRLSVTCLGTVLGSVGDPVASDGRVVIPVSSCLLPAGSSCDLAVVLDIDAGAPAYSLELLVPSDGIIATDANLGSAVTLVPEVGATLPISSGVTVLQVPADELVAAFTSQMPATLVSGAEGIGAFRLTLQNPAGEEAGRITVSGLRIRAADREYAPLVIGGSVAEVLAYHDEQIWAATPQLNENDSTAVLVPQSPLDVEPGQTIALDLRVRLRPEARTTSIRLGLDAPDIEVVQPDGALLAIRVTPESGSVFPFWSESGRFTARDLAGSYGNFPNPFAAGREITTFVYFLRAAASVSLRLLTPHGESVMTILDRAERPPGLQEQDVWDGRNGNGGVVRNGVYIAELVVDYADGQQERVLRKVAVVR